MGCEVYLDDRQRPIAPLDPADLRNNYELARACSDPYLCDDGQVFRESGLALRMGGGNKETYVSGTLREQYAARVREIEEEYPDLSRLSDLQNVTPETYSGFVSEVLTEQNELGYYPDCDRQVRQDMSEKYDAYRSQLYDYAQQHPGDPKVQETAAYLQAAENEEKWENRWFSQGFQYGQGQGIFDWKAEAPEQAETPEEEKSEESLENEASEQSAEQDLDNAEEASEAEAPAEENAEEQADDIEYLDFEAMDKPEEGYSDAEEFTMDDLAEEQDAELSEGQEVTEEYSMDSLADSGSDSGTGSSEAPEEGEDHSDSYNISY